MTTGMRLLHYPGSKWNMSNWIQEHMPEHKTYVEPFFGSGAVLFNKTPSKVETINDIDGDVVNLFKTIREKPMELAEAIELTPYSRQEYLSSYTNEGDDIEKARRFLVRCWMAIGGKTSTRTGWRSIIEANGSYPPKEWKKLPYKMQKVADRLKDVQIEQQPATQIIERYARADTLIYADPPYVIDTRTNKHYKHEMTLQEHEEMLDWLKDHPGSVLLSGYEHPLYERMLKGWKKEKLTTLANAGAMKTEVLWLNPKTAEQVYGLRLC